MTVSSVSATEQEERRIDAALDLENHNRDSVYNVPGYRPVRRELAHAPVRVSGELPADLEGAYLRNGTNSQFDNGRIRLHAFSGAGMLHQIQISSGSATYSNSYVRTPRFEAERAAGRPAGSPTRSSPTWSPAGRARTGSP
jgi:carotenoid cleavage dioxygenase-like enzyme